MSDPKSSTPAETHHEHDEELVHVPKGQSKLQFYLMVIVILVILVAFSITPAMMSSFSPDRAGETYVSWQVPGNDMVAMDATTFRTEKRNLNALQLVLGNPVPLATGLFDAKSDEAVARFMIIEEMAQKAGMRVSDQEVREQILAMFGTGEAYRSLLDQRRGVSTKQFEDALTRYLLVSRYLNWMSMGAALVDPGEVEEEWLATNQEFAFDYIAVPTENYKQAAEEQLPSEAELKAWFDAKGDFEKRRYYVGPYFSAEAAYLSLPLEVVPEKLVAAYPPAEDEDHDSAAQGYYDLYYTTRFTKPEDQREGDDDLYFAFEDVADICKIEVQAFNAMNLWLRDLDEKRKAGEEIDLAAEAERLGLEYGKQEEALTRDQWNEVELPWTGPFVVGNIVRGGKGVMSNRIVVDRSQLVLSRVIDRVESSLPEFSEIQEQVAEEWVKEKMSNVAVLRLEQVRDVLGNRPVDSTEEWVLTVDTEKFGEAAVNRGFEPRRRDYMRRDESRTTPLTDADGELEKAVIEYLFRSSPLYQLEDGQIAPAAANPQGTYAFLVRLEGTRDADIATKLDPADVESAETRLSQEARMDFLTSSFASTEWFKDEMGLTIVDPSTGEPAL